MTEPINLTQLRELAEMKDPIYNTPLTWVKLPPDDLLALIDIAEAAHELVGHEDAQRDPSAVLESGDRLREALARTTTNP